MALIPMTQAAATSPAKSVPSTGSARIDALDFTKGVLVLFMVLYHWLNYFYSPTGRIYLYLRFLNPSFIFITGFLVARVYLPKYAKAKDALAGNQVLKRLFVRGLKILGLFLVLNTAIVLLPGSPSRAQLSQNSISDSLMTVFVNGEAGSQFGKLSSFGILVPISYLLLLSAMLLPASRKFTYVFHAVCAGLFVGVARVMQMESQNIILELLAIGMLGVVSGLVSDESLGKVVRHWYWLALAYGGYLAAITNWDPYALRVVGVCLTLLAIYAIGSIRRAPGALWAPIIVLGKYSLFGYIWQMAILRALHAVHRGPMDLTTQAVSFVAGFALTFIGVEALDRLRPKFRALDQLYRVAFA